MDPGLQTKWVWDCNPDDPGTAMQMDPGLQIKWVGVKIQKDPKVGPKWVPDGFGIAIYMDLGLQP